MTSPLPPRLRDTRSLADRVRQDRANLKQLYPGFVGGRFAPARRLGSATQLGDIEDDAEGDEEAAAIAFSNTDSATATAVGRVTLYLTYAPVEGSLHVYWNGVALGPTEYVLSGQTVTFSDHLVYAGDRLTAAYAYYPSDVEANPGYVEAVLARGPLWFGIQDDLSGSSLTDYSGYGRNGTYGGVILGANQIVPNLIASGRKSASYDGVDDQSDQAAAWGSWINTTQVAWVAWINADTIGGGFPSGMCTIVTRNNGVTFASNGLRLTSTGKLEFFVITNTGTYTADGATSIVPGANYMVSGIYDGSTVQVFVNGALDGSVAANGDLVTSGALGATIGGAGGFQMFDGRIGPVAMYDPSLGQFSAADIPALYAAGVAL